MFAGLHIRANEKYQSTLVLVNTQLKAIETHIFKTDTEFYSLMQDLSPTILAIGAPTSLPLGLCCLETNCNCNYEIEGNKGRISEIQMASMSISCFYTTRGSISRNLIYRSINISEKLNSEGYTVIETYPHATKSILFHGEQDARTNLSTLTKDSYPIYPFLNKSDDVAQWDKNTLNAALSAYTAGLHYADQTDSLGDEQEGLVIVPSLN